MLPYYVKGHIQPSSRRGWWVVIRALKITKEIIGSHDEAVDAGRRLLHNAGYIGFKILKDTSRHTTFEGRQPDQFELLGAL